MEELQESYNALIKEVATLRKENAEMKALLLEHGLSYESDDKGKKGSIVSLYSPITFPPSNLGIEQRVALFPVSPISWKGRLQQYAGRLHRECEGKTDVRIYDYIDIHEPMCDNMYHKRLRDYASIGYATITQNAPTLFDVLGDLDLTSVEGQIFNGMTFYRSFAKDMSTDKSSIVISSPKLYMVHKSNVVLPLFY